MSININPIETYVPTIYVNNSEPDLDETNLNHAEQALKRVTDAANAAILALESLDSAKIDAAKIVNNLLATDTSTVLSGPMGKALGDRLTAAENLLTRLNGESFGVNPSYPGFPKIWGHVFTNNGNQYGNAAGDCYYLAISSEGKLLIGTQTNNATTITWRSGEIEAATAQTAVMYYTNNNIVIADYKTKKVYFTLNLETNILIADANGWTKKYNLSSLTV